MFVNREEELRVLDGAWHSDGPEFIVVYGRRRVGKTSLLQEFCAKRPHTFWVASLSSEALLRGGFTEALWQTVHPDSPEPGFTYESWERAFEGMAELAVEQRHIVVIDEFPYLVNADPSIPSVLQKVWDQRLQHTRLMLVLCGSHIGMMEQEVLSYRAPLYGRRTGQIRLLPLPVPAVAGFLPRYTPVQQIEAYAVLGGTPAYLAQFHDRHSLLTNIRRRILDPGSFLYLEPQFLLREELREPRNYFAILQAIAEGRTRLNEIAQGSGLGRQAVSRYLAVLQDLHLAERLVPSTERWPDKSRRGIYRLSDPFLRFWFRLVQPHRGALELGLADVVLEQRVRPVFDHFVSYAFEDAARQYVGRLARAGKLPFLPERIGAWWDRREEIDVVAISDTEGAVLVGECKWSAKPVGVDVLVELRRKAQVLGTSGRWPEVWYALFSKVGFTADLQTVAAAEGVRLVEAAEVVEEGPTNRGGSS